MSRQNFESMDVLKLEVQATPVGQANLVENVDGELGGWGWLTPIATTSMGGSVQATYQWLQYTPATTTIASYFTTEEIPVAVGQYVSARFKTGGAYYLKVRVEWLTAAGALISSSTQSGYFSGSTTGGGTVCVYTSNAAPATTTQCRVRFDVYQNTSGGNPVSGGYQYMREMTVIKTATGSPTVARTNLAVNPSFETDTTGWASRNITGSGTVTLARSSVQSYNGTYSATISVSGLVLWPTMISCGVRCATTTLAGGADVVGRTFTFSIWTLAATAARNVTLIAAWKNAGGTVIGTVTGSTVSNSTGAWTRHEASGTAPAGAVSVQIDVQIDGVPNSQVHYIDGLLVEEVSAAGDYFDGSKTDTALLDYAWTGTAHASTSTVTGIGSDTIGYIPPAAYVDILGPTHSINIKRSELDPGTLSAEILDSSLDPSQFNLIRPGKKVRVMALDSATSTFTPIFTGKIRRGSTKYVLTRTDEKRARISLTASDAVTTLANITRPNGVASITSLPYVLEGAGVPWNVNGSGSQVGAAATVASNDNMSALDQIAIIRDSNIAYAWVSRLNVLNAWDFANISGTIVATIDESVYSDLDVDYDSDRCINSVTIKIRRLNLADGKTVEDSYGPYVDQVSIDLWGPHKAEFVLQGVTSSEASASSYAAYILTANGTPAVRINSVTLPIRETTDIVAAKALLDLYDKVTVSNTLAMISTGMRVTGIEHKITPDKWTMSLDFVVSGSVATPQRAPGLAGEPNVDSGWNTPTFETGYGAWTDSSYELTRYRKVGTTVTVRGLCYRSSGSGGVPFRLPAGYRPSRVLVRSVMLNGAATYCYIYGGDGAVSMATMNTGVFIGFDFEFDTDEP